MKQLPLINIGLVLVGLALGVVVSDYVEDQKLDLFGYIVDKEAVAENIYNRAEVFFKAESYDAAIILFERIVNDYPNTKYSSVAETSLQASKALKQHKSVIAEIEAATRALGGNN